MEKGQIKWRILYGDGSHFDNTMGEPEDAPGFGIVTIVQADPQVGRAIVDGWDFYYWVETEGKWWGSDWLGFIDRLAHREPCRAVSIGRMVSESDWLSIRHRAKTDPDFEAKSGNLPYENPRSTRIKQRWRE